MTSSVESAATVVQHSMNRIDISTGVEFEEFKSAFEKAAPPFDPATVREIAERGGTWDEVLAAAAINAPNDLMVYAKIDALSLLSLAGHTTKAVEYLLGNHTTRSGMGVSATGSRIVPRSVATTSTTPSTTPISAAVAGEIRATGRRAVRARCGSPS